MKVEKKAFESIQYETITYSKHLYDSILRIGLSFPIYVKQCEQGYLCVDGHKRMSAIAAILKTDTTHSKLQYVNVIVLDYARTAPPYRMHNHH